MKRLILVQMALALIALPSPSEAGIVVIDMREPSLAMKTQDRTADEVEDGAEADEATGQETDREAKETRPTRTRTWDGASVWSVPSDAGTDTQPALEQTEGVHTWVEAEEDPGLGPVGCGGAQAARGPAGLLPLALAAAALLLARRAQPKKAPLP